MGLLGVVNLFYALFCIVYISKSKWEEYESWRLAYRSAEGEWEGLGTVLPL